VGGVSIRYTTDGSEPDSTTSPIYDSPVAVNGFTWVKAKAIRTGWYSSPSASFTFFKKGIKPSRTELLNRPNEKYKGNGAATLIDLKKGVAENFSDAAWLGFREQPFAAVFYFDTAQTIHSISISYNESVQSYLMPPAEVEIWAGEEKDKLKLLKKATAIQPTKEEKNVVRVEGLKIDIAKNVSKLPAWHPGKGDKAWIFIDEIFFN
jgi:hypothetical protein